jgi:isocitrate dehydrogenase kinase/phosphatase
MSTAAVFPTALTDPRAFAIARAMLDGFDRHYRLFRQASAQAKARFEAADWHAQQQAQSQRIEYYDRRVAEATERLQTEFDAASLPMEVWQQVKLHYIGLLINHYQPELAETFFNSVTTKILHRSYFRNDFIFVRSTVSTEHLENEEPGRPADLPRLLPDPGDAAGDLASHRPQLPARPRVRGPGPRRRQPDGRRGGAARPVPDARQFPDPGAVVALFPQQGRLHRRQGHQRLHRDPFALPILHGESGGLVIDAALFGEDDLQLVFSFARAYFMVQMEVPSAYVQFLSSLMPRKPRSEIYSALGLQKQGKSVFYRDLLMHMRHSSDKFRIAPGIKGMVMLVFDLPSFPYVFKVIKDFYPPPKETRAS